MDFPKPIYNLLNPTDRATARPLFIGSSRDFPLPLIGNANYEGVLAVLRNHEILYFGGYFNSFFDYEFQKITGEDRVTLSIYFHGYAILRVIRDNPGSVWDIPHEGVLRADNPQWFHIDIPLPDPDAAVPGSRLRFELHSQDHHDVTSLLIDGYWGIKSPEKREVNLGVVMCTYNNERLCLDNLLRIISTGLLEKENIHFLLVDNAANLKEKMPRHENVHYVSQNNLGGAGGFTRGIMHFTHKSLEHLNVSHLLLMDDDISLEPEMLIRIKRLQEYVKEDSVIGGAMFNLTDPCGLHEMGAFFSRERPSSLTTDHVQGMASEHHVLNSIGRATEYDYTAWWFCSFSTDSVREVGLPYPLFIRRDDTEYGERLRNSGRKIYCASGVGIWHAPFQGKPITWMQYFDIRNDYINFALTDTERPWSIEDMAKQIDTDIRQQLLRFDYGRAELILLAIEDFLEGPDILKQDPQIVLKKVRDAYDQYQTTPPKKYETLPSSPIKKASKIGRYLKKLTYNYQYGIRIKPKNLFVADDAHIHWQSIPNDASFASVNNFWRVYQYFEKQPSVCKTLIKRKKRTINRFLNRYDEVIKIWKSSKEELSSVEFWTKYVD